LSNLHCQENDSCDDTDVGKSGEDLIKVDLLNYFFSNRLMAKYSLANQRQKGVDEGRPFPPNTIPSASATSAAIRITPQTDDP
jgi:hypothetical protein